ncbi:hypothetical protein ABZ901_33235, partial [Actinacidiphila alni]|uniref:hypothetical protein n=1 Tax=Actinacidiphila alni TaxID=380248 RepID=UPI0033F507C6
MRDRCRSAVLRVRPGSCALRVRPRPVPGTTGPGYVTGGSGVCRAGIRDRRLAGLPGRRA